MTDQLGASLIVQIQFGERLSTGVLEVEPLLNVGEGPVIDIHKAQHCNLSASKDFESLIILDTEEHTILAENTGLFVYFLCSRLRTAC